MAKACSNRPAIPDRSCRLRLRRSAALAERSGLPALSARPGPHRPPERQDDPSGPATSATPARSPLRCGWARIFEDSHLPLHLWLQVIHLMCASKKGIATRQIQRMLNCSMKTAWFLGHRIRLAMDPGYTGPMGGEGKTVETDETEIGPLAQDPTPPRRPQAATSRFSASLSAAARSVRLCWTIAASARACIQHWTGNSRLVTDSAPAVQASRAAASHEAVDHSKYEWARGDVHTNTLEGFFSIFKRGIIGVYQHVDAKHFTVIWPSSISA